MKIVTTCPSIYPGVSRVFEDGAALNLWKHIPTEELKLPVEADLVIFGGSYPPYHLLLDQIPQPKWIMWTSPLLQTELATVEMDQLLYYVREQRISRIWFGDTASAAMFPKKGFYAPYPVAPDRVKPSGAHDKAGIALMVPFGNKNKNVFNQLAAVKLFQETHPDIGLVTGGMLPEQRRFADEIGLLYKDVGWRSGQDYMDDLHACKVSLHVTLSESFGYGVLDSMLLDTPCLVGPAVSWVPRGLSLVCGDPSSPTQISNSLSALIAEDPPPDVRPIALSVAKNRNDSLDISMRNWEKWAWT